MSRHASDWDLANRHLYLCTPDREDVADFVRACIRGGVDLVQLRDKQADDRRLVERARMLRQICEDMGVPFIMNDRPDLAVLSAAHGVHVGQDDVAARAAREVVGPDAIVGLSTHAPSEIEGAVAEPVDYISAGPVVPTPTKPGRPGTGLDYIRFAVDTAAAAAMTAQETRKPVFVTGGITPDNVGEVAATGARHFVVVRYLTEADDPKRRARLLRDSIEKIL